MQEWDLAETTRSTRVNMLEEVLIAFFKHKYKALYVLLFAAVATTLVLFLKQPVFESRSTILLKMGREYLNRTDVGDSKAVQAVSHEEIVNSEIQIVTNRELIESVIAKITIPVIYPELISNPSKKHTPMEAAVAKFEKALAVEGIRKSSVIQVSFRHKNPQVAAKAVDLLVDSSREKHLQVFSEPQSSFASQQMDTFAQKLKESEHNLESFKQKKGVFSLEEQRSLLLKQRTDIESALMASQNYMNEVRKRIESLKLQVRTFNDKDSVSTNQEQDRVIIDTKAKLLNLRLTEQELLKKYTVNNRLVVNARKEIELVENFLRDQESESVVKAKATNPHRQELNRELLKAETDLEVVMSKNASLRTQMNSVEGRIRSLDLSEQDLGSLKREKDINERKYQMYAERSEEARRIEEMNHLKLANISIIQRASIPFEPVSPKKRVIALIGLACGIIGAFGIIVLAEMLNRRFSTPAKVEQLTGLPVLLAVPYMEN